MKHVRSLSVSLVLGLAACPSTVPDDDDSVDDDDTVDDDDSVDDDDAAGPWEPFRMLALNLHCLKQDGTDYPDSAARMAAVTDFVAAEGVAVLAFQEVCRRDGEDALAMLEAGLGDGWTSAWYSAHTAWEGTPDEADEGLALFVRGTLTEPTFVEYFAQPALRRIATVGTLPPEYGGLRVASVHLDVGDAPGRQAQARETATRIPTAFGGFDVVLAGDFNAPSASPTHDHLRAAGFSDTGEGLDVERIDYIYAHRAAPVEGVDAALVFTGDDRPVVSDHPGVLVTMRPMSVEVPTITRLVADVDVGFGRWVAARGTLFPGTQWDTGWAMEPLAGDRWELLWSEAPADEPFAFKVLRDDVDWQQGDDVEGTGGAENRTTPVF